MATLATEDYNPDLYRMCRSVAWPLALSVNILSQCICLSTDDALVTYWENDPKVDVFLSTRFNGHFYGFATKSFTAKADLQSITGR